jgi:CheY-like chemotaxis protein
MRRLNGELAGAKRILIVDDNVDSAESLSMLLMLDGYQTLCVHDGRAAVAAASSAFAPDVVLLDIGLPELSGHEVARVLRADHGASLALIALSGWDLQDDDQHSPESGFDAHLVKPVDYEALRCLLQGLATRGD